MRGGRAEPQEAQGLFCFFESLCLSGCVPVLSCVCVLLCVCVCFRVCVCVGSGRIPCHHCFLCRGRGGLLVATPTKLSRMTGCIKGRLDVYLHQFCNVLLARGFSCCVCFMLELVTFSTLEGSRVHRKPKLIRLETYRLYSRLISCTRDSSVVLERLDPPSGV